MERRSFPRLMAGLILVVLAVMLFSACGSGPALPTPTRLPTATPTPRSTPLPEVPTPIPLATEDNPLTILMLPQGNRANAREAASTLEEQILTLYGLTVDIQLVNSYGEIVAQLCGATPVVGWVDGFSYIVAGAQGCGDPEMRIERDGQTGFQVDLLVSAELRAGGIAALADQTLCRLNSQDVASWLVPGLMLRADGVNPLYDLETVADVESYDALVTAIYNEDCQAGGVPHGYLDDVGAEVAALEDLSERVLVLDVSPEIPYDILVYPQTVPLNVRIPLNDAFMQIAAERRSARTLAIILNQDRLERVDRSNFAAFNAFMASTGLNFAALGQ